MLSEGNLEFKVRRLILIGSAGIVHKKTAKQKAKMSIVKLGKKALNTGIAKKNCTKCTRKFKEKNGISGLS